MMYHTLIWSRNCLSSCVFGPSGWHSVRVHRLYHTLHVFSTLYMIQYDPLLRS